MNFDVMQYKYRICVLQRCVRTGGLSEPVVTECNMQGDNRQLVTASENRKAGTKAQKYSYDFCRHVLRSQPAQTGGLVLCRYTGRYEGTKA